MVNICIDCGTSYPDGEECPTDDCKKVTCFRCECRDSKFVMSMRYDEWYCENCFDDMFVSWSDAFNVKI